MVRVQRLHLFPGKPELGHHGAGDRGCLLPQRCSGRSQGDSKGTLIAFDAAPGNQPGGFQPAEERRDGGRLLREGLADVTDGARAGFPEAQHHQVLRVRQSQPFEDRLACGADHTAGGNGQREAQLPFQQEVVVGVPPFPPFARDARKNRCPFNS